MSVLWPVAVAACAVVGAASARPVAPALWVALALVVVCTVVRASPVGPAAEQRGRRRPPRSRTWWLLGGALVALAASTLGARAEAGLDEVPEGRVAGAATVVGDPRPDGGDVRLEARLGGRRVELRASGTTASRLAGLETGDRLSVVGRQRPAPPSGWYRTRHVAALVTVWRAEQGPAPVAGWRVANAVRHLLARGAASLDPAERALFDGLVMGDDRAQDAGTVDDFRGAGLTHLLAVSGQNVAFVLAVAAPVLRRARLWPRLWLTLGLLVVFAMVTRCEPSVLRAATMAAVASVAATAGRPASGLQVLAVAVAGLVLVDPLLVDAAGFQLSVAACAAILVGAAPLERVLPGPEALRAAAAVTIAAQIGVAPLLVARFGPLPGASLPANLLAGPVAGFVMGWGLLAGLAAGLVQGPAPGLAAALHLPTRVALAWVAGVARRLALAPLGALGPMALAVVAAGLAIAVLGRPRRRPRAGLVLAAVVLVATVVSAQAAPPIRATPAPGLAVWRSQGAALVVVDVAVAGRAPRAGVTLDALRRAGVRRVDVVVAAREEVRAVAAEVARRYRSPSLVEPSDPAATLRVGGLDLALVDAGDRLLVEAADPLGYRSPPHVRAAHPGPDRGPVP